MTMRDLMTHPLADLRAAFGLLSRLPVPGAFAAARPEGAWAWPVVGAVVAGAAVSVGAGALALGLPAEVAAVLAMMVQAVLTGGLHEDGLADCADGLWGGRDVARRLEIMKDSRIGSYGALTLGLVLLLRWTALSALLTLGAWGALLVAAAVSRSAMAGVMAGLPNARGAGLSHSVGRPAPLGVALGLGLAVALSWGFAPVLVMTLVAGGVAVGVALYARAKIGGQTGDVLGATQQLTEVAALIAALAVLS